MRVSLNQITQFINFDLPPVHELVARINSQLGKVDEVVDIGAGYEGAVIAKVVRCTKHENADKLSVCEIDAGTSKTIQVVCGAPNVREGIFVVWLKPGATVPATYGDKEPFVLEARELRGVVSNGMLASAKELGLGDSHDGILEIDPNEWKPTNEEVKPGTSFAKAYGLNDKSLDIENKMFTHRPDLFGQLGVAREIAGIHHNDFTSPSWYTDEPKFESSEGLELEVLNDAGMNVPRFMAVAMKGIEVKPSPLWLQCALVALGSKPINNIVDVTNYVMLLTAQPTHAYDYDKLRGHKLGARMAQSGEKAELLNGKTYDLTEDDIVIVDGDGVVGLGGIMGGGNSEVSAETKNIVLEVANFNMYTVRKSSMRHGLFTDALTRFNKGQSALQNDHVMNVLMMSIKDVSSAEQASKIYDDGEELNDYYLDNATHQDHSIHTTVSFINDRLGLNLSGDEQSGLLENVEMRVHQNDDNDELEIFSPFWRTDMSLPEDIVEEVGRLYGFDKLPRELPKRTMTPASTNEILVTKKRIRESLSRGGANEVLTYSFVHKNVLTRGNQDPDVAFKLSNALSPDLQYYRLSVLPSLLDKVHANIKGGFNEFTLFEIGKGHNTNELSEDGLPRELEYVDLVYANKQIKEGAAFYKLRAQLDELAADLGLQFVYTKADISLDFPVTAPFDLNRSAMITTADGVFIGMVGELKQDVRRNFKLPSYAAAATLDLQGLSTAMQNTTTKYQAHSKFPRVTQDITLRVADEVGYGELAQCVHTQLEKGYPLDSYQFTLVPRSIYRAPDDDNQRSVTFRLTVACNEKTLKDADVAKTLELVEAVCGEQLHAERV